MTASDLVFYDCEASDLEGYPIEIGWAFVEAPSGAIVSESYLVPPPPLLQVKESLDRAAERLHGIALARLQAEGRPVDEIARRMNAALAGRELYADDPHDVNWLRMLLGAAHVEPAFTISSTDAKALIALRAAARRMGGGAPRPYQGAGC